MALEDKEPRGRGERRAGAGGSSSEEDAIELEDAPSGDLEAAMRDALAAVVAVEESEPGGRPEAAGGLHDPAGRADSAANPDAPPVTPLTPLTEVAELHQEIADLRDRSMRTLADFDNYRKRAERERQEVRRYALVEPLRELLPVADNLERALAAGGSAEDMRRGVEMIARQMQELLRRLGVQEVPSTGAAFDPALHEAVAREESAQVQAPVVAETLVRGYQLHDRLLRPAMVKVAVPVEEPAASREVSPGPEESPR